MDVSLRSLRVRRQSAGLLGGILFLAGAVALLVFLAVLAALALLAMALVGVLMGAERLLGLLVPAYRRRRRARYLNMPTGIVRMVRFGPGRGQLIEARSRELHERARKD